MFQMRNRKKPLGDKNIIGKKIEIMRKEKNISQKELLSRLQVCGADISPSTLSKIEGQIRKVTDIEALAFSQVLGISIAELFKE